MTEKERLHLKEHNATMDWTKRNNERTWGCPNGKTVTLAHILHTARNLTLHPSVKLERAIVTFDRRYPHLKSELSPEMVGGMYIVTAYFFLRGYITSPIYHYLIYSLWMGWTEQRKIRHKPKVKKEMLKHMEELGIIKLMFEEANKKLMHLDIPHTYDGKYRKPKEDYVSLRDAIQNNNHESLFGYSFDK